jgi:hypothetical protein
VSSFTDRDTPEETLFYYIQVPHPTGCYLSKHKAASYNTVRSNRKSRKKSDYIPVLISSGDILSGIQIYPNPGTGIYTIKFHHHVAGSVKIMILDTSGKVLSISEIIDPVQDVEYEIDLNNFTDGVYQVTIIHEQFLYHRVIIKE